MKSVKPVVGIPAPLDQRVPLPDAEAKRLAALRRYHILDTEAEETFDRLVSMTAAMFGAKFSAIGFVDADRVWFKSSRGGPTEISRAASFCAHTILDDDVFVVPDASKDSRFSDDPDVVGEAHLRFYAAAPLITRDGQRIGTLSVFDVAPHSDLTVTERERLATLAHLVMNELELRLELRGRIEAEHHLEFVNRLMQAIVEAPTGIAALETSIALMGTAVNALHCSVMEIVSQNNTVQMIAAYCPDVRWAKHADRVRQISIDFTGSITSSALARAEPMIIPDLVAVQSRFPQMIPAIKCGAARLIVVPLVQGQHRFAMYFYFGAGPDDMTALAVRLVELAEKAKPALARKVSEESISLLQSVVLGAYDAAMVVAPDVPSDPDSGTHIVYVNPATVRMTGYDSDELIGKPPSFLWGQQSDLATIGALERKGTLHREFRCGRKDGSFFWADVSAVPARSENAGKIQMIATLRDTTERRRLEEALREREQHFHLMFSSAPVPMMLVDLKTQRYVEVNDCAIQLFGYTRDQFRALSAEDIRSPHELERYKAVLKSPVPGTGRRGLWHYRKADGSEILVDVTVHPFRFQGRAMAITVTVDVTEQKRVETQIRRARDAAEAASRAKSDMLSNMSHELRTPLNAIIGFSQIMQAEMFGPLGGDRYRIYAGDILDSANHLLTVINDILDLAKIEANSFNLRETTFYPAHMVESALRLVGWRAEQSDIKIGQDNDSGDITIHADETALKRVMVNLLSNAVKFSEAGTCITIRCWIVENGGEFAITVKDEGIGMGPEEVAVALTPFRQVDNGLKRKYDGTGLGLPIAKELAELHGGRLVLESAPGAGTSATIFLPAWRLQADPVPPQAQAKACVTASATAVSGIVEISLFP